MGETTRNKTQHIFKALLALGCLEDQAGITRYDLIDYLKSFGVTQNTQARRLMNLLKTWLNTDNDDLLTEIDNGGTLLYEVDLENVQEEVYLDFLDTFLSLYELGNRQIDDSIKSLYNKRGRRPLGVITDLVIAIKEGGRLSLNYRDENQENNIPMLFYPQKIYKRENRWCVEGRTDSQLHTENVVLNISKIITLRKH